MKQGVLSWNNVRDARTLAHGDARALRVKPRPVVARVEARRARVGRAGHIAGDARAVARAIGRAPALRDTLGPDASLAGRFCVVEFTQRGPAGRQLDYVGSVKKYPTS